MYVKKCPYAVFFLCFLWFTSGFPAAGARKEIRGAREAIATSGPAILWTNPVDIELRDLFYGPGGRGHVPRGEFTFVKEDLHGTNPKFVVEDQDGVKWQVKLGLEARPETAASRIVWAAGYRTDEDYFVPELQVYGMPTHLHRGQTLVGPDGSVRNVRLKRESDDDMKIGHWRWRRNDFTDTRELNGLRALMALINNWDLKDENNAIYREGNERVYLVSDLGASFGTAGRGWPWGKDKGNLGKYRESRYVRRVTSGTVDFQAPARPKWLLLLDPKEYLERVRLEWIGRNVPRADARWIAGLLGRLSTRQVRDAFRAAGYSSQEVDEFTSVLESRIAQLTEL